jgi:hypothetical protein
MRSHIIALTALVSLAPAASATLISLDLNAPGDGLLTLDPSTGFKWLDITQTVGHSYNSMQAELVPGGAFDGYRRATTQEVDVLFTSAGIIGRGDVPTETAAIQNLLNFNGTPQTGFRIGTTAFASNPTSPGWHAITAHFLAPNESFVAYARAINNGEAIDTVNFGDVGHWLIQVPTPGAATLFAAGGLLVARRRR